jgi:hypothetical protein
VLIEVACPRVTFNPWDGEPMQCGRPITLSCVVEGEDRPATSGGPAERATLALDEAIPTECRHGITLTLAPHERAEIERRAERAIRALATGRAI